MNVEQLINKVEEECLKTVWSFAKDDFCERTLIRKSSILLSQVGAIILIANLTFRIGACLQKNSKNNMNNLHNRRITPRQFCISSLNIVCFGAIIFCSYLWIKMIWDNAGCINPHSVTYVDFDCVINRLAPYEDQVIDYINSRYSQSLELD